MRGKYIVLEGPEGVGKTTQIEELARRLQAAGLPVRTLREPDSQSDLTARALRQLTQDPRYPMNTNTEVLLYNAARSQSLQVIKNSVEQGVICIVDRNYLTTLAIQYYGRGDVPDYETINRIISFAVNGMEPDLCIVLDAPVQTLKQRAHKRGQGERFDNLDEAFLERVRAGYLWEAKQRNLPVVFATEDSESIANEIWKLVSQALAVRDSSQPSSSEPVSIKQILETKQQAIAVEPPVQAAVTARAAETVSPATNSESAYVTPAELDDTSKNLYVQSIEQLLQAQQTLLTNLPTDNADVTAAAQLAMPVAALLTDAEANELMAESNLHDRLATFANSDSHPKSVSANVDLAILANYWPRSEFNVLPNVLYAASNQSLRELNTEVDGWSYDQKAGALELAISNVSNTGLVAAGYSIELRTDYHTLLALQKRGLHVVHQQLTPRYGYAVPAAIEQAGLDEPYQACFDLSLQLHSQLQAAGANAAAQFVTLGGHQLQAVCTLNATQLGLLLPNDTDTPSLAALLAHILEQISGVHPLITQSLVPETNAA